jgi:hypothetical protein
MGTTFSNPQPEVQSTQRAQSPIPSTELAVNDSMRQDMTDPFNQPMRSSTPTPTPTPSQRPPSPSQVTVAQSSGGLDVSQLQPRATQKRQSSINCRSAFQALNLDVVPYWKNSCQIDIDKVDYVWIFSSYNGNGWWFMNPTVNSHVEKLYQDSLEGTGDAEDNHLVIGGHDFKYNFDKMCQINRSTGTNRTIRRLDMSKVKEIEQACGEQFQRSDFIWLYQAGSAHVPFMANYQEELEAAYQDYLDNLNDEHYLHYNFKYSNGYEYQLNFRKKTQLNRHTGVRRAISRVPRSEIENHPEYQASAGFGKTQSYHLPQSTQPTADLNSFDQVRTLNDLSSESDSDGDDDLPELEEEKPNNNTPFDEPTVAPVAISEPDVSSSTQLPTAGFWSYRPAVLVSPWVSTVWPDNEKDKIKSD